MHFPMADADDMNTERNVTFDTINLFSKDKRFNYFISDVPH